MAKDNINGVAYNTKTAEAIVRNGSGRDVSHSDERWYNETLYRKKSGEFFLYGSGGVFTKYAKQTGPNSWERSEAILPLTEKEVRQWAMNNLDDDGYKSICQKIEEKPIPVIKEKRQYNRHAAVIDQQHVNEIIDIIQKDPSISQLDLAQKAGLTKNSVVIIMDSLKASGRLTRTGSRRKGQWIIDGVLKEDEPQNVDDKKPRKMKKRDFLEKSQNDRTEKILNVLHKRPSITQRTLAKETGISLSKVNAILQQLHADGTIIRDGTSKRGSWIIKGEEPKLSVITIYGMHSCPDCSFIEDQIKGNNGFRFLDIGSHIKNLKAFMTLRDANPVFDSVKNKGIGIPAFVHEDGTVTLIPEDVGLKSRSGEGDACNIADRSRNVKQSRKVVETKDVRSEVNSKVQADTEMTDNTEKIISMIRENPSASQTDFQKATNLTRMQVVTILNHLKADGRLERTGSRRSGQWIVIDS